MIKKLLTIIVFCSFLIASFIAILPKNSNAIPPFAQKYHFSCAVCHTTFPNLNPFGRAFWRNGFRLPNTNGTPTDATQITKGLSIPNPWPVPIAVSTWISYQHYSNENVSPQTDAFSNMSMVDFGGVFKLYSPFANSLSFFSMNNVGTGTLAITNAQFWASLNGIGSGFGIPSHLLNLKIGTPNTAAPYFDKQFAFWIYSPTVQALNVGFGGEGGNLVNSMMAGGFAIYGTTGHNLWYKLTVTNDGGMPSSPAMNAYAAGTGQSNAMEYSYQLKEYYPVSAGQLEFGYYGATIAEPLAVNQVVGTIPVQGSWTNRVIGNGVDVDLANNIYEIGATYYVQHDSHPYGNPSVAAANFTGVSGNTIGNTHSSNGYSTFELYGRYIFPQFGYGLMLAAEYAQYSWSHKGLQEAFNAGGQIPSTCASAGLYQSGAYHENNTAAACVNGGIQNEFDVLAEYSLAYNAHVYVEYLFTNKSENNTFGTGLAFGF